jgi:hypothetical protein
VRIEILDDAGKDLVSGFRFYESQAGGLGTYFLDSLYADIDLLLLYAGVHRIVFGSYRSWPAAFRSRFSIALRVRSFACEQSSIAVAILYGSGVA